MSFDATYYGSRYVPDSRRREVWRAVAEDIGRRFIDPNDTVLELGCGYGDFISQIQASRRMAVDIADVAQYLDETVAFHQRDVTDLSFLDDAAVDVVFSSNLLEHLSRPAASRVMSEARRVLRDGGRFIAMQPNFRYCYATYFDDYTHETIYTDTALADMMAAHGYRITFRRPRYLPFSMKGRLPKSYWLTKAYLMMGSPVFGKQMLIVGAKDGDVS